MLRHLFCLMSLSACAPPVGAPGQQAPEVASAAPAPPAPPPSATAPPPPPPSTARLIFIGDTGALGGKHTTLEERARLAAGVRAEKADAVFALGDMIYPHPEPCPDGVMGASQQAHFQERLVDYLGQLGAPTWMALGNHDVHHVPRAPDREACYLALAKTTENIEFPDIHYTVDTGPVRTLVLNTNDPGGPERRRQVAQEMAEAGDRWVVMAGHHVLRTYGDKESETRMGAWLLELTGEGGALPHLFANGHAHLLQFGVYQESSGGIVLPAPVPGLTSGVGAKLRTGPECNQQADQACPSGGLQFAAQRYGYAVVDLTASTMTVRLRGSDGGDLGFCWQRTKADPLGRACDDGGHQSID